MGSGRRRRQAIALVAVALALIVGGHYIWFTLFGPPARWGTGGVSMSPTTDRADVALAADDALVPDTAASLQARLRGIALDGVDGTPFELDVSEDDGMAVLQTHAGATWSQAQHLYARPNRSAPWRELAVPPDSMLSGACLVQPGGGPPAVLVSAWQPWWPYQQHYGRFFRSFVDPPRRAENAVYLVDPEKGGLRYLLPGEDLARSPDRRFVAYVTSENDHAGFHTIRLWTAATGASTPVLSLWESDPSSGRSFTYRWSARSDALHIDGATLGFTRSGGWRHRALRLAYLVDDGRLLDAGL
jgi:hypothetical protein